MSSPPSRHDRSQVEFPRLSTLVRILLTWPLSAMSAIGVLSLVSGCVVPIGPEFRDPRQKEPVPDLPPSFDQPSPPFEKSIGLQLGAAKRFAVDVVEPNGDQVFVRFVLNYPPYVASSTKVYPTQTSPPYHFSIDLSCEDVANFKIADRNLAIIVTDKGFAPDPDSLLDLDNRYTYEADGKTMAPTVAGWRLNGCP
jgi:hypothetical protein